MVVRDYAFAGKRAPTDLQYVNCCALRQSTHSRLKPVPLKYAVFL